MRWMLLVLRGFAFRKLSSVIMGQSRSDGSQHRACIPRDFNEAANILALVLSPIAKISSLSVSTSPTPPFVRCSRRSVVLPTALATTTTRFPRAYSRATDATARPILFGLDKLEPPNLTISRRRRWWEEDGRRRDEEGRESWSARIWCLCLVVEDGLDAALMPVKMTTHRLHTRITTMLPNVPI